LKPVRRVKEERSNGLCVRESELYLGAHTNLETERDGTKELFLCGTVNANTKKQTGTTKMKGLVGTVVAP